jgi:lipase
MRWEIACRGMDAGGDNVDRAEARVSLLRTPAGATVKVVERGGGASVVFLHSGVGSAGEWRGVFELWPEGHRLVAVDAYGGGAGPGVAGGRRLDDYADQVLSVVEHVGEPIHLVGFSWGGATALHVGATASPVLASLTVIEPEAYSLLRASPGPAFAAISELRDRWQDHVRAGRWYEAFEEFIDFYNGPGTFARWPASRRDRFLDIQRARGDLWDVLFEAPLTASTLREIALPVHVVEGSATSVVDHTICDLVRQNVPHTEHTLIDGAGHMIPLTHATQLSQALIGWITRRGESSRPGRALAGWESRRQLDPSGRDSRTPQSPGRGTSDGGL